MGNLGVLIRLQPMISSIWIACLLISQPSRAEIDASVDYVKKVLAKVLAHQEAKIAEDAAKSLTQTDEPFKVIQYLSSGNPTVIISGGRSQGMIENALLFSYRPKASPLKGGEGAWIKTGKLKAIHVDAHFTLAEVIDEGDKLAQAFFPRHPNTMAGDVISEARYQIVKNPVATPTSSLQYDEIFEDPKSDPLNFELTEQGKASVKALVARYANLHVPVLFIEGYTDDQGPSDANQVESYQRALTIRHYLVDELGFSPERVVAIGYGESNLIDMAYRSGYQEKNRRIVFRVNVHASDHH